MRFKDQAMYIERPQPSEDEPAKQAIVDPLEHKTLAELNDIDPYDFSQERGYKCTVTVTDIPARGWWYLSCKPCKKKPEPQLGGGYKCPKCSSTETLPRYLLSFTAKDDTAQASFFAYDEVAVRIVMQECKAVLNPLKRGDSELPQPLQAIISKKFTFAVTLTDDSFTSKAKRQYQISSILDRSDRRGSTLNLPASQLTMVVAPPQVSSHVSPPTSPDILQASQHGSETPPPKPAPDTPCKIASPSSIHVSEDIPQTPPAATLADPTLSKTRRLGSFQTATQTRRSLLHETNIADKGTIPNEDVDVDTNVQAKEDTPVSSSIVPKPKRQRTKGSKQHSKDNNDDSSSVTTPE